MENKIRILVIGAGPSGLSTLKALKQLEPAEKYQIVCIEKQPDWSGQWNYTTTGDIDQFGENIHSSMYSQLWTNIPKQCFQFPDYTFKQHFGKSVPAYLPRQIFKGYFMSRFERFDIKKYIKFNHSARNVQFNEQTKIFEVIYTNLQQKQNIKQNFNYVVAASGHFSQPNIPEFKGIQQFKGRVVHSHSLRQFDQLADKNVLIIGGGLSGEDLSLQCYKYGSSKITWTYRSLKRKYNTQLFPKNIQMIPGLSHFDENSAYFSNGQIRKIDVVIMCTGYLHSFPFLQQNLRLSSPNIPWPPNLYKSVVFYRNPQLFYVGMGNYLISQIVFDVQGYLIRDIISGKQIIPELKQKHPDDLMRQSQMKSAKSVKDILKSVTKYLKQLIEQTSYLKFPVQELIPMFCENMQQRARDMINYRDTGTFKSVHTGQQSCLGNVKWIDMKHAEPFDSESKEQLERFFKF